MHYYRYLVNNNKELFYMDFSLAQLTTFRDVVKLTMDYYPRRLLKKYTGYEFEFLNLNIKELNKIISLTPEDEYDKKFKKNSEKNFKGKLINYLFLENFGFACIPHVIIYKQCLVLYYECAKFVFNNPSKFNLMFSPNKIDYEVSFIYYNYKMLKVVLYDYEKLKYGDFIFI